MKKLEDFNPISMDRYNWPDPITQRNQQKFYRHVLASLEKHIRFILDRGVTSVVEAELLKLLFAEYRLVNKDYDLKEDGVKNIAEQEA